MKTEAGEKRFDCVKWTREVRNRIYEETKDMSFAEHSRWLDRQVREDPFFALIPKARTPARSPMDRAGVPEAGSSGVTDGIRS